MSRIKTLANRLLDGDSSAQACVRGIIRLRSNNLVERPWGGLRMLEYKGCAPLPDQKQMTGMGVGEAFEVAACDSDPESNAYPSRVCLPDGSQITLPGLLQAAGREILGTALFARFGGEIPLLPKTLDIEELLSVQAHPPGNTELYVIIDAEPDASIRLGFRHDVDMEALRQQLIAGRQRQQRLLSLLPDRLDQNRLQAILAPAFADRDGDMANAVAALTALAAAGANPDEIASIVHALKVDYWDVLDLTNEVRVRPGQIIYNATPDRVCAATGIIPSAEVHALGNPEGREILMLEIRRPGVTYRAWDNVRFPVRDIDIDQTVDALNSCATSPADFEVAPRPVPGSPGVFRSVSGDSFVVDHIRPEKNKDVVMAGGHFHTLHAIRGAVTLEDDEGNVTKLVPGESVIAPATLGAYRVRVNDAARETAGFALQATTGTRAELVCVRLPDA